MTQAKPETTHLWQPLADQIKQWGAELGFDQIGITDADPGIHAEYLKQWLGKGYEGEMAWMRTHQSLRESPRLLVENAQRVIIARMDYLPPDTQPIKVLKDSEKAYLSRYSLGRDYHKLIRKRLSQLSKKISNWCEEHASLSDDLHQRPFVDSAPILEKGFAEKAGLGWIGKHTVLIHPQAGSWFFLGELITNLPLPMDEVSLGNQCGSCDACLKVCPTDAFVEPYKLDASRCISYLTIELKGSIPEEFRQPIGNRVFGCDDCQLICPWNKWAKPTQEPDFSPRHELDQASLIDLFLWTEEEYLKNTEGSPIRRIGYERWLRNLAIGLGNAQPSDAVKNALSQRLDFPSDLVKEHVEWAIERQLSSNKRIRKIKRA